jgi:hypothetical protein
MVRLELTLAEMQQLHQGLMDALAGQTIAPERQQPLQLLLTKLQAAADKLTCSTECPVCHTWFTQDRAGRCGRYCSPACKQKAYRQRQRDWRKRTRSAPRR